MAEAGEKNDREELSRMAYEAQVLQGQGQALQQQLGILQESVAQLEVALESVKSLKTAKGSSLVPLGGGAMVRAKLESEGKVLIDVGAGVVVEKEIDDAVVVIEARLKEAEKTKAGAERDMMKVSQRLQVLDGAARGLMRKLNMVPGEG